MLKTTAVRLHLFINKFTAITKPDASLGIRFMSKQIIESDDEFEKRYQTFFNRPDIDGWDLRKGMNDICGMDLIPQPKIITAALKACRRVNDYALAIRFLEAVKDKYGPKVGEIYPYILQEIKPSLVELGIDTLEDLGYDKPELAFKTVYDL